MSKSNKIQTREEKIGNVVINAVLILFSVLCAGAFVLVLSASFQSQSEISHMGYSIFPRKISLEAYKIVLANPRSIIDSYAITILTTLIGTVGGLWLSSTCGYVMSRRDYPYRNWIALYIFFTMLFNGGLVPGYILVTRWLNIKNTIWALILPSLISPWYIMLMKSFFFGVPEALIESAKLDGASELTIFVRIVLPISKPVMASVGLFYVLSFWNSWFPSLLYSESPKLYTLQYLLINVLKNTEFLNSEEAVMLGFASGGEAPTLNVRMAMCVLAAGPILIVFPFFQKYFTKGVTVGAVKG